MKCTAAGRLRPWVLVAGMAAVGMALAGPAAAQQAQALPDTLDLSTAVDIAVRRSPLVAGARAQADAAGAGRRAAWGQLLPTATASLGLNRNDFTKTTFVSEEGVSESLPEPLSSASQGASQGVSLNWTLLDPANLANLRRQSADVRSAQRRVDDQRAAAIAAAKRAFFEALQRQRLLELAERQIADRELELEIARRRYEIAAVERTDVLAAESNLLNARIGLLNERRELDGRRRALAVALGLRPEAGAGTVLRDVEVLPPGSELEADVLVDRVLQTDPELLAIAEDRAAASADLWSARSRYLPRISASVSWNRSQQFGPDASFFQFDPGDTGRSFSVSAQWTLFDGFQREQQAAQAGSRRRQAAEDLRRRRLEIERDVRGFAEQIDQLGETLDLLRRSFQISQERLAMTRQMYQLGTIDFTALQQAINDVTSVERQLVEQRYNYLIAWANLEEYVGGAR